MYHLTQFGVALPPGQARVEAGTGAVVGHEVALPSGGLYDAIGTGQAQRGATRVRLLCELVGDDAADLKIKFNALRQMVGIRRQLHRRWECDSSESEWTWARLEEIRAESQPRHPLWLPVEMRFLLLSPYWYGAEQTATHSGATGSILLANSGNITVSHLVIKVTATTTMSSGVTITNSTLGGAGWTYAGALSAGEVLIVDSGSKAVTKNGVAAYAPFSFVGSSAAWLPLAPSGNHLAITIPSGSATIQFAWHDGWV
jgi:hypothetical protein